MEAGIHSLNKLSCVQLLACFNSVERAPTATGAARVWVLNFKAFPSEPIVEVN